MGRPDRSPEAATVDPPMRGPKGWVRYAVHPLLLGACAVLCAVAISAGADLQGLLPVVFIGLLVTLLLLERLMPFRRDWGPTGAEAARDGVYLVQGVVFGGLGQLVAGMTAVAFAPGDNGLSLWVSVPLAVVLSDLCTYGFHRFVHANGWMWREHGIHHVTDKVNALNANTAHFLDILLNNIVIYTPLLVLGFGAEAVFIVTVVRATQTYASHANVDMRLGWLGHVFMGPEHHRLHHSVDPSEAGNYATVLTLWDRVFGTFCWASGRTIEEAGVAEPRTFPQSRRIWASAVFPFRPSVHDAGRP